MFITVINGFTRFGIMKITREFIKKVSKTFFVLACCLILVSCFEEGSKTSGKKDVTEILENRESQATNYARSIQQYSALVMQNLMEEARANDMQLQDLWTSGAGSISETGLVDISGFANMNAGRMNNQLSAAYCNGAVFTWIQGEGGHQAKLKGLGESGSEAIGRVLSKQLGSNGYGIYKDGMIETASGGSVNVGCAASELIPEGTPVIFNAVAAMDLSRSGTHYEFFNENCPSGEGFIRYRRQVSVEYDTYGEELSREEGEQEVFINACMEDVSTVDIAVTNMPTVSVVDFAAQSGGGDNMTATKEVICFEAELEDGEGGQQQGGSGGDFQQPAGASSMTNCYNPGTFETSMPQGVTITCGVQPNTTETQMMACQGSGWTGDVTYEREVEYCRIDGGPDDGNIFQKRKPWERTAVDCQRNETQSVSCPFGAGLVIYSRINTITNPVTLAPNNPDWNYTSDSCSTDEVSSCVGAYAGNGVAFRSTTSGNNNPPNATTGSMASYCGSGSLCTRERTVSCGSSYVGTKEQRSNYLCGSGWSSWADHDDSRCQQIICTPGATGTDYSACPSGQDGQRTRTHVCNSDGTAWGPWSSWDSSACTPTGCGTGTSYEWRTVSGLITSCNRPAGAFSPGASPSGSCSTLGQTATTAWYEDVGNNCRDSDGNYYIGAYMHYRQECQEVCTCDPTATDTRTIGCPSGYTGSITQERQRQCPSGNWGGWSNVSNSCVAQVCSPGSTDTQTQACGSGYTGNQTRTRTCNSSGTAWSSWSGWNTGSCVPTGGACAGETVVSSHDFETRHMFLAEFGPGCRRETTRRNYDIRESGGQFSVYRTRERYEELDCDGRTVTDTDNTSEVRVFGPVTATDYRVDTKRASAGGGFGGAGCEDCEDWEWDEITFVNCPSLVCSPGSTDSQTQACGAGYTGNQTRTRTCNGSGSGYGSWGSWNRSSCVAQVCSPGSTDTQSNSCGSGFTGTQYRSRSCNGSGTGYGSWGSWNRSGCTAVPACTIATATEVDSYEFIVGIEGETSEDGCHQDQDEEYIRNYVIQANGTGYRVVQTYEYERRSSGCEPTVEVDEDTGTYTLHTSPNNIDLYDVTTDYNTYGGGAGGDAYSYTEVIRDTVHFYRCP